MGAPFISYMTLCSGPVLFMAIMLLIWILSKGADILVDEAAALSARFCISKLLVGLVIVSIGTTIPEAAVSVIAAVNGQPEIALGNAVGSIICNTGLILGLVTLFAPISLDSPSVKRQGWFQFAAGILLVASCVPFFATESFFETSVLLPRYMGMVFLILLALYLWGSFHWLDKKPRKTVLTGPHTMDTSIFSAVFKIILGSGLVVSASHFLIPAIQVSAVRMSIPQGVVSATMVAFGTSLPELVTSIRAVQKGHGELALGNIIGANILNVLFVAGAAATITSGGLAGPVHFSRVLFPAMLGTLIIFGLGMHLSGNVFKKSFSIMLLGIYAVVMLTSYFGMAA
ncbi:MAG: sodium:calcium antiporter [Desulfotignum sp.]|jgi:cation:H+ antiporter|nr:sodium:calcium antiporter [Desulfotignum sp.]